ncbi:MAG: hypothetical protein KC996_03540 [Phycisphaerales bacterium]|nr:hypothetical protein [Phycisphaerales bacterium]
MPTNPIRQSSPSAREGKVLAGCLIALGVAIVLAVIATVILFQYRRTVFVSAINVFADKAIAQMPIDQTERDEVRTELDGLLDLYKTKQIDRGQLSEVFEAIAEDPAMPAAFLSTAADAYIAPSALTEEEKADGLRQMRRFSHAVLNGKVSRDTIDGILGLVLTEDPNADTYTLGVHIGSGGANETRILTPRALETDTLREILSQAGAAADEAEIETDLPPIDLSETLHDAIERAMQANPEPDGP